MGTMISSKNPETLATYIFASPAIWDTSKEGGFPYDLNKVTVMDKKSGVEEAVKGQVKVNAMREYPLVMYLIENKDTQTCLVQYMRNQKAVNSYFALFGEGKEEKIKEDCLSLSKEMQRCLDSCTYVSVQY